MSIIVQAMLVAMAFLSTLATAEPILRAECAPTEPGVRFLGWDTEGGRRCGRNLLRAGSAIRLRVFISGDWTWIQQLPCETEILPTATKYRMTVSNGLIEMEVRNTPSRLELRFVSRELEEIPAELHFPFDPRVTPTTAIPADWNSDDTFALPAVLNAPDFGPVLLAASVDNDSTIKPASSPVVRGRFDGSRSEKRADLILAFTLSAEPMRLTLSPLILPPPDGQKALSLWESARRGWLNALQPCAQWGDQKHPFSAPAGMLANNVISDPASCSLWFYADQILWMPQIAPGVSAVPTLRRTLDWWLDKKVRPDGEVICYWEYGGFLDANAGSLIAAWDYVECTGDMDWLKSKIDRLELVADYLLKRDIDSDGMIEAVQSGNLGTLVQPNRSCAWWDALNCGHKDGYTNAVIYRAFRCMADLERQIGRADRVKQFAERADRLKASFSRTLMNPQTGWLAWWKSKDGQLHDYASPTLNGIAIEYGLIEPAQGREILEKFWAKFEEVGFKRFDLGVPPMLVPVLQGDYLSPNAIGRPERADGTDTFGHYMNGGITAGHVLHFLAAHYVVGFNEPADRLLKAMLARQQRGEFQNGVTDEAMRGIDWTTWEGQPCGYEGYLADSFRFLQAVLIREPALRARLYRPLQ